MNKSLVIFGTSDIAQLAHYYFSQDSEYKVAAFTVDREYMTSNEFCGLPVVAFEEVAIHYPYSSHDLFIGIGYSDLNQTRKKKYLAAKNMGYRLATYVSSHSTVLNEGRIGENSFILEDNTIQPFVSIGNNVILWSGNHIGHHSTIRDHCFIASHVVISGGVTIEDSCFIGVNATLRDNIRVGEKCILGAGTLLLSDALPGGIYMRQETERSRVPSSRLKKI